MTLLEMNHIKKSFDGTDVLRDISLSVEQGEYARWKCEAEYGD